MIAEGAEVIRMPPSPQSFLLQLVGMDSTGRARTRRGESSDRGRGEEMCSQSLRKKIWRSWQCDNDLKHSGYTYTRVYILPQKGHEPPYSQQRRHAHAHQPMKEIPPCATDSLRSSWRLALRGSFTHASTLPSSPHDEMSHLMVSGRM